MFDSPNYAKFKVIIAYVKRRLPHKYRYIGWCSRCGEDGYESTRYVLFKPQSMFSVFIKEEVKYVLDAWQRELHPSDVLDIYQPESVRKQLIIIDQIKLSLQDQRLLPYQHELTDIVMEAVTRALSRPRK
jgi:hypothetical protein